MPEVAKLIVYWHEVAKFVIVYWQRRKKKYCQPGFLKLVSPKAKANKTLFVPIKPTNSSANDLQRPEQFWNNCKNIV